MARKTLIFGNGLGMALDANFYSLDAAIGRVWDGGEVLDEHTKGLVRQCLFEDGDTARPHGEEDLDQLQLVVSACDFLHRTGHGEIHWLSDQGRQFPAAVRKFLYRTALHFHQSQAALPLDFTRPLAEFVHDTKSHIATLNYDSLLYQPMIEAHVLSGYGGPLVDGLVGAGFAEENLARKFGRQFGYYMHLHGSPLFVDREGRTYKLKQSELDEDDEVVGSHIVLTHVEHKEAVIAASGLLSSYWLHLSMALAESEAVLLIGYSGCDKHLNALLRGKSPPVIRIIEWDGAGTLEKRLAHWRDLLGERVEVVRMSNILEFSDW